MAATMAIIRLDWLSSMSHPLLSFCYACVGMPFDHLDRTALPAELHATVYSYTCGLGPGT